MRKHPHFTHAKPESQRNKVTCPRSHTQWLDREEAPEHFPEPNLHQKKKKVKAAVWWSAAGLIHYSFLNPGEPITSEKHAQQINEMHRKLQCLQLALANRKGSVLLHDHIQQHLTQPTLQKLNCLGDEVSPCLPYSPDLSPPDYLFFKHLDNFLQEKLFYNQQDAGNTFQEFPRFLHYKTYFSLAKKC